MASNLLVYTDVPKVPDERICPICSEEAPPGETHHPHYGGICCYGCRAFFRRANQRSKKPKLNCKSDGSCEIAPKGQARCKKCRYLKCLSVGMDPKWVMTNEQKKIRFQHYFKKKQERESATDIPTNKTERIPKRKVGSGQQQRSSPKKIPELLPIRASFSESSNEAPLHLPLKQISANQLQQTAKEHLHGTPRQSDYQTRLSPPNNRCDASPPSSCAIFCSGQTGETCTSRLPFCTHNTSCPPSSVYIFSRLDQDVRTVPECSSQPVATGPIFPAIPWSSKPLGQGLFHNFANTLPLCYSGIPNVPRLTSPIDQKGQISLIKPEPMDVDESHAEKHPDLFPPRRGSLEHTFNHLFSLQSQLNRVLDAFTLTCAKLNPSSQRVNDLVLIHQKKKPLEKMILISQLSMIASMITEFATSLFHFKSLTPEDQITLLKCNIPLYLQYIMARYFNAGTGLEQLSWILEGQVSIQCDGEVILLTQIGLKEYNISTNLFANAGTAEIYHHYAESIGMFYQFPQHCNALIANLLLYRTNESMIVSLKEPTKIMEMFEQAKDLVKLGLDQLDRGLHLKTTFALGPLIHSLETMKNAFDTCQVESDGREMNNRSLPSTLSLRYTETEEAWLKHKYSQFKAQYASVEPPEYFIKETCNLLAKGECVSQSFIGTWMIFTKERLRRVLRIHPEFASLSDYDQAALFSKNHMAATAIGVAHMEVAQTGTDQLRLILGYLDKQDTAWKGQFPNLEYIESMKKQHIHNAEVNRGRLDQISIDFSRQLTQEVSEMVSSDQIFLLFALVTLLDTDGMANAQAFTGILKMRQMYLKLYQRKLMAAGCSYVDYSRFQKTLQKIKILASFLEAFLE